MRPNFLTQKSLLRKNKTQKKSNIHFSPHTESRTVGYHFYQPQKSPCQNLYFKKKVHRKITNPQKVPSLRFQTQKGLRTSPSLIPLSTPWVETGLDILDYKLHKTRCFLHEPKSYTTSSTGLINVTSNYETSCKYPEIIYSKFNWITGLTEHCIYHC